MPISSAVPFQQLLPGTSAHDLRVVETDFRTDPRWQQFVTSHVDGLIYHHPGWLEALQLEYGQKCVSLACEDSTGRVLAILPLFYTRGMPFGLGGRLATRRLASLPRTPLAGPLSIDRRATLALLENAVERVRLQPGMQLQIKMENTELDGLVKGLIRAPWRVAYVLQVPDTPDKIRFGDRTSHHRVKWAVNKAKRSGLRVRKAETLEEVRTWYRMYLDRMRHNLVPARPYRFFARLWELLRPLGLMELLLVEQQTPTGSLPLAGSIYLVLGKRFIYAFTGSYAKYFPLHPNDLLQWEAIHEACRRGCHSYDFGEVPEEHQELAQFKGKWCADPRPLFHYCYPACDALENSRSIPDFRGRHLLGVLWRHVPLSTTARLGDYFYGYL